MLDWRIGTYRVVKRPWRNIRVMFWMLIPELLGTVATLVLTALQQPDLFRTSFWQIGSDLGLNSNPNMLLYAYANHRPLPKIPFVWSATLTNFNVAISILSLFIFITKLVLMIMKVYFPPLGTFIAMAMTALYATSVAGWIGPDYADPRYPAPVVWYVKYGCSLAEPYNAVGYCMMAKATLAVAVLMMVIYLVNFCLCIYTMLPNPKADEDDEDEDDDDRTTGKQIEAQWEMQPQTPATGGGGLFTPRTPFTPRTQAFNTLNRNQYS